MRRGTILFSVDTWLMKPVEALSEANMVVCLYVLMSSPYNPCLQQENTPLGSGEVFRYDIGAQVDQESHFELDVAELCCIFLKILHWQNGLH